MAGAGMSRNLWPDIFVSSARSVTLDHCHATYCHVRHHGEPLRGGRVIDTQHPARRKSPMCDIAYAPRRRPRVRCHEKSRDLYVNARTFLARY